MERTRFEALQQAERRDGFAEAAAPDRPFFRRGGSGAGRAELTERQIRRIVRDHGSAMRRLGYAGAGEAG